MENEKEKEEDIIIQEINKSNVNNEDSIQFSNTDNEFQERVKKKTEDDVKIYMSNDEILADKMSSIDKLKRVGKVALNVILDIIFVIMIIVVVANIGFTQLYETANVRGESMLNTFASSGEVVVYRKMEEYSRGEVIVYKKNSSTKVIKRIIAFGGDRIKIDYDENGVNRLYLNGEILNEPYLDEEYSSMDQKKVKFNALKKESSGYSEYFDSEGYLVIPEGYLFYMGDNRLASQDCIEYGPVKDNQILGKVIYKYPESWGDDRVKILGVKIKMFYGNIFGKTSINF